MLSQLHFSGQQFVDFVKHHYLFQSIGFLYASVSHA